MLSTLILQESRNSSTPILQESCKSWTLILQESYRTDVYLARFLHFRRLSCKIAVGIRLGQFCHPIFKPKYLSLNILNYSSLFKFDSLFLHKYFLSSHFFVIFAKKTWFTSSCEMIMIKKLFNLQL